MVRITVERVIDLPIQKTWDVLADFSNVHKVHPLVKSVDQKTPNDRGEGAVRTCHFYDGGSATEKIVAWDEPQRAYTVHIVESSLPVKKVEAVLSATAVGEDKSKVVGEMDLVAKFGVLGWIMERLIMKPKLGAALGDLFAGIEQFSKTGKEIPEGYKANTPALIK